jgi:hypothetical protein
MYCGAKPRYLEMRNTNSVELHAMFETPNSPSAEVVKITLRVLWLYCQKMVWQVSLPSENVQVMFCKLEFMWRMMEKMLPSQQLPKKACKRRQSSQIMTKTFCKPEFLLAMSCQRHAQLL